MIVSVIVVDHAGRWEFAATDRRVDPGWEEPS